MRVRRRGKALVVALSAAFALGDAISKACPAGYARLDAATIDSCVRAAVGANRPAFRTASSFYPTGCYWHTFTDTVYLNDYAGTIEAETYARPICAGAPTMPAHFALTRTHVQAARPQERRRAHKQASTHANKVCARRRTPFHPHPQARARARVSTTRR